MPSLRRGVAGLRLARPARRRARRVSTRRCSPPTTPRSTRSPASARGSSRPTLPHRFGDYAAATGRIIGAEGYRFVGAPGRRRDAADRPARAPAHPARPRRVGARLPRWPSPSARTTGAPTPRRSPSVDALLTPTARTAAIPIDQVDQTGTAAHFTRPGNYLGLCARGRAERLHRGRPAHVAPDPRPCRRRGAWRCGSPGPTSRRRGGRFAGRRSRRRADRQAMGPAAKP